MICRTELRSSHGVAKVCDGPQKNFSIHSHTHGWSCASILVAGYATGSHSGILVAFIRCRGVFSHHPLSHNPCGPHRCLTLGCRCQEVTIHSRYVSKGRNLFRSIFTSPVSDLRHQYRYCDSGGPRLARSPAVILFTHLAPFRCHSGLTYFPFQPFVSLRTHGLMSCSFMPINFPLCSSPVSVISTQ